MGFNVLAYDYPGYGTSGGRASEQGCYDAIGAAYSWLREEKGIPAEQIVLFGRSVGGGPTIDLAARQPVGGVILDGQLHQRFPGHDAHAHPPLGLLQLHRQNRPHRLPAAR